MLTNFDKLSQSSRIWIYQANRALSTNEQKETLLQTEQFVQSWAAHGNQLVASATILYSHFLIIGTDEGFAQASGCSIDSSFRFVQEMSMRLGIDFLDRSRLAFLINDHVELIPLSQVKEAINKGSVTTNTPFFNNTIQKKSELDENWVVKAGETWLNRYFEAASDVLL